LFTARDLFFVVLAVRVLVKVLEVLPIGQLWDPWRLNPLVLYDLPVNSLEPIDGFDVLAASAQTPKAFGKILLEQPSDECSCRNRDMVRELIVPHCNSSINIIGVLIVEWRVSKNTKS